MRWLDGITDSIDMSLTKPRDEHAPVHGVAESDMTKQLKTSKGTGQVSQEAALILHLRPWTLEGVSVFCFVMISCPLRSVTPSS